MSFCAYFRDMGMYEAKIVFSDPAYLNAFKAAITAARFYPNIVMIERYTILPLSS